MVYCRYRQHVINDFDTLILLPVYATGFTTEDYGRYGICNFYFGYNPLLGMLQTSGDSSTFARAGNDNSSTISYIKTMEKGIKLYQAIVSLILLVITVGSLLFNQANKIETQRLRIEFLESASRDQALQIKDLNTQSAQQVKEINAKLTEILVALQNKQNKK